MPTTNVDILKEVHKNMRHVNEKIKKMWQIIYLYSKS